MDTYTLREITLFSFSKILTFLPIAEYMLRTAPDTRSSRIRVRSSARLSKDLQWFF